MRRVPSAVPAACAALALLSVGWWAQSAPARPCGCQDPPGRALAARAAVACTCYLSSGTVATPVVGAGTCTFDWSVGWGCDGDITMLDLCDVCISPEFETWDDPPGRWVRVPTGATLPQREGGSCAKAYTNTGTARYRWTGQPFPPGTEMRCSVWAASWNPNLSNDCSSQNYRVLASHTWTFP
jgi:hypothetical protein